MFSSRIARRVLAVTASLGIVASVSGCGGEAGAVAEGGQPIGAIAFVIGARSNMPAPRLDGQALEALDVAVANQSQASVVVADGEPSMVATKSLVVTGGTDTARKLSAQENREAIANALRNASADGEESNLLAALGEGVRTLPAGSDPRTMVVVDSGLSTADPLDFTQPGLLDADPTEVVESLLAAGELPDLTGVRVVAQGLGDTAPPQERLSIPQRKSLIALWRAVLLAAGASEVIIEERQLLDLPADDLPDVTEVPLSPGLECTASTIVLTGGDVAFEPDSDVFRDRAAAEALLMPIAEQLAASGATATLTGTTADVGSLDGQQALSLQRAEAVRDLLVRLGVPASNLTVLGLGSDFPGYVEDHAADGTLIPAAAAANRKVVIEVFGAVGLSCD